MTTNRVGCPTVGPTVGPHTVGPHIIFRNDCLHWDTQVFLYERHSLDRDGLYIDLITQATGETLRFFKKHDDQSLFNFYEVPKNTKGTIKKIICFITQLFASWEYTFKQDKIIDQDEVRGRTALQIERTYYGAFMYRWGLQHPVPKRKITTY